MEAGVAPEGQEDHQRLMCLHVTGHLSGPMSLLTDNEGDFTSAVSIGYSQTLQPGLV